MTEARYHRHNLIDWFSQEKISHTKVAVIGAGAVGNEVIKNLALLGVGEIHIFDLDLIEEHNLTRSVLFRESDIGRAKAEVASIRASELDANIKTVAHHGDFWDQLLIAELKTFDILFCCVDNFEARIRCNTLCYLAAVDFVNTGIDSRAAVVEFFPFSATRETGCYECSIPSSVYQRIGERYSCGHLRKISFIEKKVPTTIITSSCAASLAVSIALQPDIKAEAESNRIYLDTISGNLTKTVLGRAQGCACCGRLLANAQVIPVKRNLGDLSQSLSPAITVTMSEPILSSYRIAEKDAETVIFKRASDFDSSYPESLSEDPGAVALEIRDQFTLGELAGRFADREMPCKFATVSMEGRTVVFEFLGDRNG